MDLQKLRAADPVLDLTCELIARESVTPEDAGCQALLAARLDRLGFTCEHLRFGDVDNLWATWGDAGPMLTFVGHTDVVPSGDPAQWRSPPFVPETRDGVLYGRGAADMKSAIAAVVVALEQTLPALTEPVGRIGFMMTSDEEGAGQDGVRRVMQTLAGRERLFERALVIEPSSKSVLGDQIRVGRRGSLGGTLTVRGVQGHVAYPHLARNPIHLFAPALAELTSIEWDRGNAFFPATSLQFSNILAGTGADNVIPGMLHTRLNFRFCTESTPEDLQARFEAVLKRHALDYTLDWHLSGAPFLTGDGPLVRAVKAAIRTELGVETEPSTGGGTSDGRFIAPYGIEVVELGPVNASIHKVDEHVAIADLAPLADVYGAIVRALCAA